MSCPVCLGYGIIPDFSIPGPPEDQASSPIECPKCGKEAELMTEKLQLDKDRCIFIADKGFNSNCPFSCVQDKWCIIYGKLETKEFHRRVWEVRADECLSKFPNRMLLSPLEV